MARHKHSCKKNITPDNISESSENELLITESHDNSPKTPPTKKNIKKNIKV